MNHKLPLLLWAISCFDKTRKNPLPVYNKWYWLDWTTIAETTKKEIISIIQRKKENSNFRPDDINDTVFTLSLNSFIDNRMLKFRTIFTEVPNNDLKVFLSENNRGKEGYRTVNLSTEYFEDENKNQITKYEMMQFVTGQEFPIIRGNSDSILKLPYSSPINVDKWSDEKSNTVAQFLDVIQRIKESEWHRTLCYMTSIFNPNHNDKLLEADFANDKNTMEILPYFRQLHAGDKLLTKTCDIYIDFVGDTRKKEWMKERKNAFISLIDSQPDLYDTANMTRRQIIRMFMYGAGLLHSSSNQGDDIKLKEFIKKHGKHKALIIFNSCLFDFLRVALTVYIVIQNDYNNWIGNNEITASTRIPIPNLFKNYKPKNT